MKEPLSKSSRVYTLVKRELLDGTLPADHWIDVPRLARKIGVSLTPVRYALYELSGEGLLEAHARQGFYTPELDENTLRDLFELKTNFYLTAARSSRPPPRPVEPLPTMPARENIPLATAQLFMGMANAAGRPQLRRFIELTNDRLRLVQRFKLDLISDLEDEFADIYGAWARGDTAGIEDAVERSGRRRLSLVSEITARLRDS